MDNALGKYCILTSGSISLKVFNFEEWNSYK